LESHEERIERFDEGEGKRQQSRPPNLMRRELKDVTYEMEKDRYYVMNLMRRELKAPRGRGELS